MSYLVKGRQTSILGVFFLFKGPAVILCMGYGRYSMYRDRLSNSRSGLSVSNVNNKKRLCNVKWPKCELFIAEWQLVFEVCKFTLSLSEVFLAVVLQCHMQSRVFNDGFVHQVVF